MPCSDLGRELDGPCPVPIPADPLCGTSGAIFTLQMVPLCLLHLLQPWESLHTDPEATLSSGQLAVFFLPLLGAGLHLAFAFPMIRKMLMLLNLTNIRLFALTTVISFVVFALFYVLVYRITSNAYFHIVRGTRSRG